MPWPPTHLTMKLMKGTGWAEAVEGERAGEATEAGAERGAGQRA